MPSQLEHTPQLRSWWLRWVHLLQCISNIFRHENKNTLSLVYSALFNIVFKALKIFSNKYVSEILAMAFACSPYRRGSTQSSDMAWHRSTTLKHATLRKNNCVTVNKSGPRVFLTSQMSSGSELCSSWRNCSFNLYLKGTVPRDFRLLFFFHESVSPKPLSIPIGPFRIFSVANLPPVSLTPVANLPPVSITLAK